jgi:hypothetical protein
MTFPTPHIGIFYKMDCQSHAKPSEKDHDLPGIRFEPGTFGLAVSIANHYTI